MAARSARVRRWQMEGSETTQGDESSRSQLSELRDSLPPLPIVLLSLPVTKLELLGGSVGRGGSADR